MYLCVCLIIHDISAFKMISGTNFLPEVLFWTRFLLYMCRVPLAVMFPLLFCSNFCPILGPLTLSLDASGTLLIKTSQTGETVTAVEQQQPVHYVQLQKLFVPSYTTGIFTRTISSDQISFPVDSLIKLRQESTYNHHFTMR